MLPLRQESTKLSSGYTIHHAYRDSLYDLARSSVKVWNGVNHLVRRIHAGLFHSSLEMGWQCLMHVLGTPMEQHTPITRSVNKVMLAISLEDRIADAMFLEASSDQQTAIA